MALRSALAPSLPALLAYVSAHPSSQAGGTSTPSEPATSTPTQTRTDPAPLVCAPLVRELDLGDAAPDAATIFMHVRRGADSFCFVTAPPAEDGAAAPPALAVMATEPLEVVRVRSPEQEICAGSPALLRNTVAADPMDALRAMTARVRVPDALRHAVAPLNGVAFGFVGFDVLRTWEPRLRAAAGGARPRDELGVPEAVLMLCGSLVVLRGRTAYAMALCPLRSGGSDAELAADYAAAAARVDELAARVEAGIAARGSDARVRDGPIPAAAAPPAAHLGSPWQSSAGADGGRGGYSAHVAFMRARIGAGDMVQAVPSHRLEKRSGVHPLNVWRSLRRLSPARYSFFVEAAHGLAIVGASPEMLLRVGGGWAETHPIAGTRPRGADAAADAELARRLLADEKERAEHTMLVDLGRNDLARVCAPGSVVVPRLMDVRLFSHVMHIVSVVRGRLADGVTAADAFRAVFPAGTVSGAPKLMAVEHIYAREGARRGPYAGSVGYFDASGAADADTAIAIRSLVFVGEGEERRVCAQAGGGIVIDSIEEAEYQETLQKMAGPVAAVAHAEETSEAGGLAPTAPPASATSAAHNALLLRKAPAVAAPAASAERAPADALLLCSPSREDRGCILLIDNYCSFTFNLFALLVRGGRRVRVVRNDAITVSEALELAPSHIMLGPGPCSPSEAGVCGPLVRAFGGLVPILGVCLGMEVMVEAFGGRIAVCPEVKHGKTSALEHDGRGVFAGVPQGVEVVRYHSLAADAADLAAHAPQLRVTSVSEDTRVVMAVRHAQFALEGLQFHPESIKTERGPDMVANFLSWSGGMWPEASRGDGSPGGATEAGPPSTILQRIVDRRAADVAAAKARVSEAELRAAAAAFSPPVSLLERVLAAGPEPAIVAEVKRASPSRGVIAAGADAAAMARAYAAAGAAGISVLTEPTWFGGSLEDLAAARRAVEADAATCGRPRAALLRKDFITDEYQLLEAAAAGADAVLLIVASLSARALAALIAASRRLGMEPLVEAADAFELARARAAGARLVGVNARDLHTFKVSVDAACGVLREGAREGGERLVLLGLSGVSSRSDVVCYARAGAHGALVGEHLMRVRSPARAIAELLGRPRPPLVKICGVCSAGDAVAAVRAGSDLVGLIFAPASKRALTLEDARPIVDAIRSLAAAKRAPAPATTTVIGALPAPTAVVGTSPARLLEAAADERPLVCGVFAGQSATAAAEIARELRLDVVQFSGGRAEEEAVFETAPPLAVFRAAHVREGALLVEGPAEPGGPIMLLDSYAPEGGGTGVAFDWARVARAHLPADFVLAGGLTPSNVASGVRALRPFVVDVCSGVEARAREKDLVKVDAFVRAATAAQAPPSMLSVVAALVDGRRPSPHDIASCVAEGVSSTAAGGTVAAFLTALAMRPDVQHNPAVLLACRRVLLERALDVRVPCAPATAVLDIVGTGGDGADTFNVSTAAALVVAAVAHARGGAGLVVAKHGNRSSAGRCGAADFMEAAFSAAVLAPGSAQRTLDALGYGFLFAPAFHPALAAVRAARREVGVRTVFNLLGPLVSPARPSIMLLGVSRTELGPVFAELLRASPEVRAALVVHGADDGVDELSPSGRTLAWLVRAGAPVRALELRPAEDFGLGEHPLAAVAGGTPAANAARWAALLRDGGTTNDPPLCDYVCLSAGAAIHLAGLAPDFRGGAAVALEAIKSGVVERFAALVKESLLSTS